MPAFTFIFGQLFNIFVTQTPDQIRQSASIIAGKLFFFFLFFPLLIPFPTASHFRRNCCLQPRLLVSCYAFLGNVSHPSDTVFKFT